MVPNGICFCSDARIKVSLICILDLLDLQRNREALCQIRNLDFLNGQENVFSLLIVIHYSD